MAARALAAPPGARPGGAPRAGGRGWRGAAGGAGGAGRDGGEGGAGGEGGLPAPTTRFAADDATWSVPTGLGTADQGVFRLEDRRGELGAKHWTTLDLDGDGLLDLVSTGQQVAGVRPGVSSTPQIYGVADAPHWRVWRGTPTGFTADFIEWPVPGSLGPRGEGAAWLRGDPDGAGLDHWQTLDLDGDGRPDLVSMATNQRGVRAGYPYTPQVHGHGDAPHWKLWRNEGDGFAAAPVAWAVPAELGEPDVGMIRLTDDPTTPIGLDFWTTLDLDGDGRLDVVSTANNRPGGRPGLSATPQVHGLGASPYWKIWRGGADGFAQASTRWPVPAGLGEADQGVLRLRGDGGDPGERAWDTLDLDGDGRPDLVSTAIWQRGPQPGATATRQVHGLGSAPHWQRWANEGDGFASAPTAWAVPASLGPPQQGAAWLAQRPDGVGLDAWVTLDLDGDGRLDLVSPAANRAGVRPGQSATPQVHGHGDAPFWRIWRGGDDGFAAEAGAWPVPGELGPPDQGPYALSGDPDQATHWVTLDVDGDGAVDLLSPARGGRPTRVHGHPDAPHWRVWRGE
ncbi:MAG: VCBS repeat-containing protein [Myxococcales bacterium]|nr:VCBS repeat-containing protein [Myxococcales bacterium]